MSVLRVVQSKEDARPVPYSREAEEAVIGACLLKAAAADRMVSSLSAEQFYAPAAQETFRAIQSIYSRSEPIDLVTVSHELFATGKLEEVGGSAYLHDAMNGVPTPGSCVYYAKIVSANAVLRGIEDAGQKIVALASSPRDLDEVCADVESIAIEATERRGSAGPKAPDEFIPEYLARIEASSSRPVPGAPTGLRDFDLLLGGLKPAALVTLAADSGLGKSALAVAATLESAIVGHSVLFFSLEMPAAELTERMVAYLAAVPLEGLQRGTLDIEQDRRASDALGTLHRLPIRIEDSPPYTTLEIAASCRRQKASPLGLGLVVVDHLGLVTSTIRGDNRPQQVSEITRNLKLLARQQHVPVLALCQYKKTGRPSDSRPTWDDLKDSSSIRHDSDVVTFIWQPDAGLDDHRVLIVAKHRSGRTADVHCHWNGPQVRFENGSWGHP